MTWLSCFLIWKRSRPSHSRHQAHRTQARNTAHSPQANSTVRSQARSKAHSHRTRNTARSLAHSTSTTVHNQALSTAHSPQASITARSRQARNTVVDHLPLSITVHHSTAHRHHLLASNNPSLPSPRSSCTRKAPLSHPINLLALLHSTLPNCLRSNHPNLYH